MFWGLNKQRQMCHEAVVVVSNHSPHLMIPQGLVTKPSFTVRPFLLQWHGLPAVFWGMGSSGAVTVPKTQPAVTLVILPWPWQLRPGSPKNPGKGDSWLYQESASWVQVPLGFPGPGIGHTGWARRAEKRTEPSFSLSVAFQIACIPVTISER